MVMIISYCGSVVFKLTCLVRNFANIAARIAPSNVLSVPHF